MAQNEILVFGTGGIPHSSPVASTVSGIHRIRELGLGCMELEFVRQAKMSAATAREVAAAARESGIRLSAHAPYYINLNSREPEKVAASQARILQTARIAAACGARSVVFHAAFYMSDPPDSVYRVVRQKLAEVLAQIQQEGLKVDLRPEIMGKGSEFGTIEEICRLSRELAGVKPAVDVAHLHAREGKFNSYDEFTSVFSDIGHFLGPASLKDLHIHFSGIRYGAKGEISHLDLADSDFKYRELLKALRDMDAAGSIVCESPNLESDALLLQDTYRNIG